MFFILNSAEMQTAATLSNDERNAAFTKKALESQVQLGQGLLGGFQHLLTNLRRSHAGYVNALRPKSEIHIRFDGQMGPWRNPRISESELPCVADKLCFNFNGCFLGISLNQTIIRKAVYGDLARIFVCCVEFGETTLYFPSERLFNMFSNLFEQQSPLDTPRS